MNKIAVFICGPKRYTSLVKKNLSLLLGDFDYDNFYFIWDDDLTDMKRNSEFFDLQEINQDPKTKILLMHKPYSKSMINELYGENVLGHSNKNAMIGMFYSISALCSIFKQLPDVDHYSHILRIRSDCVMFNVDWLKNYKNENQIIVSDNPLIPTLWTSDHIFFGPASKFIKLWAFSSSEQINNIFVRNVNNPELLLSSRIGLLNRFRNSQKIRRYVDYHIVYTDKRNGDPEYISNHLHKLPSLFDLSDIPHADIRVKHFKMLNSIKISRESNLLIYLSKSVLGEKIKKILRDFKKCLR